MNYSLEAMVLSATNMDAMVGFYANVFGVEFKTESVADQQLYTGEFAGMEFTLVPVELSQITDPKNPTHYDIYVDDLQAGIDLVEKHGGKTNGQLGEDDEVKAIGVFDPDGNFMVLKQRK